MSAAALLTPAGGDSRVAVLQVLRAAAGSDAAARSSAHQQLQELETRPGFVSLLLEAYADPSADQQGRLLAVMMCKNVVDRQWQPRSGQGMSGEEKTYTKECILKLMALAISGALPYFVELVLVLRRMCRFDFPKQWDELAHFLLGEMRRVRECGQFDDSTLAVVIILHHVLKEQSSKKLLSARREFQQIGQVFLEPVGALWTSFGDRLRGLLAQANGGGVDASVDDRTWKLSRYLDGCFMLLLCQGFARLHETPSGPELLVAIKDKAALLFQLLRSQPQLTVRCPFFAKNVKSVGKWWALLLSSHPLAFARVNVTDVLRMSTEVIEALRTPCPEAPHEQQQLREAILRSSFATLTHACNQVSYRCGPQAGQQDQALQAAQACHHQFKQFLQRCGVDALCELCCEAALRLPAAEVAEWLAEPEEQFLGPGNATELRQGGEALIRALSQEPLGQPLVQHIARRMHEELAQPPSVGDTFDIAARRDALLSLLGLCQPLLKPHLAFDQLLGFCAPVATLAVQASKQAPCVLLPVRLCSVVRSWCAEIPHAAVPTVLQMLQTFLQAQCPKVVRLAALGPLRELVGRFSDHEAWSQAQGPLIDGCFALLVELKAPEVQWRCLNLIHQFLREEAENGRYEITERTLQQLLLLWRQPDSGGEGLICLALLDVIRALVLMSCRAKSPRLPLSPSLLACALAMVSDCYAQHWPAATEAPRSEAVATSAALAADALAAAGSFGEKASASATLFDSASVLFIGVLRTVDAGQAAPLVGFFPQLLAHFDKHLGGVLHDGVLDILLEYCALYVELAPDAAPLQPHYAALLRCCRASLEATGPSSRDRSSEVGFALLQVLLARASSAEALAQVHELAVPLLNIWCTGFDPHAPPSAFRYPLQPVLQLLATWHARQPADFRQRCAAAVGAARGAELLLAGCRLLRPVASRASVLWAVLALAEDGGGAGADAWREVLKACGELLVAAEHRRGPPTLLLQLLQALKSTLATKLPVPARSSGELQCCMLPPQLRQALQADGTVDEAAVVRWLVESPLAQALRQLGARSPQDLQTLLASAPEEVRSALSAVGV